MRAGVDVRVYRRVCQSVGLTLACQRLEICSQVKVVLVVVDLRRAGRLELHRLGDVAELPAAANDMETTGRS